MGDTPRRVFVRGTSGAGKTTLAKALAERLGLRYVEMDSLHHLPNWQERPTEELQAMVDEIVQEENWVIDGNYGKVLDRHMERADLVVWLDYSFPVVFWRVFKRTMIRSFKREVLWAGNRESLTKAFFRKDSILLWVITTHARRRKQCEAMAAQLSGNPQVFVRLRNRQNAKLFLETFENST